MKNPFAYGGVVGSEDFCNRQEELAFLEETVESAVRIDESGAPVLTLGSDLPEVEEKQA